MPAAGDVPFLPAVWDTLCGFASDLLVCRRVGVHPSTFAVVALCCFCGGRAGAAQNGGSAVYIYLLVLYGALIRSSVLPSVWSASGLQPEAHFARAGHGRPPSS